MTYNKEHPSAAYAGVLSLSCPDSRLRMGSDVATLRMQSIDLNNGLCFLAALSWALIFLLTWPRIKTIISQNKGLWVSDCAMPDGYTTATMGLV